MNETITPEHQLPTGTILNGKYEIIRTLGEGGFGITYMGHNIVLDIPVAIKEYYPHGYANRSASHDLMVTITDTTKNAYFSTWKDKFLEEAKTLSKFEKIPNIVNVLDFFEQNGTAYIVMEYLSGVTLSNFVKVNGPFKANDMCAIMIPLLRSLDKIHQAKLIHRDISPDNIMVMEDGSLKLYDFGAAREYSDVSQKSLSVMLKPGYAPEEQYRSRGNQGPWTDVYAVCATMYFCITGVKPDDSPQRVFSDELRAPSALGITVSQHLEEVIMTGMSVRAEDRFQSANALATALEKALALSIVPKTPVLGTKPHTEPKIVGSNSAPNPRTLSQNGADEYSKVLAVRPEIPAEKQKGKISLRAIIHKLLDKSNKKAFIGIASCLVVCGIVTGIAVIAVNGSSKNIESSPLSQSNGSEQQSDSVGWVPSDTVSSLNTSSDTATSNSSSKLEQSTSASSSTDTSISSSKPEQSTSASSSTNTSISSSKSEQSTSASSSTNTSISSSKPEQSTSASSSTNTGTSSSKPEQSTSVSSSTDYSYLIPDNLFANGISEWKSSSKLIESADRLQFGDTVIIKGSAPNDSYDAARYLYKVQEILTDVIPNYMTAEKTLAQKGKNAATAEDIRKLYIELVPTIDKCLSRLRELKSYSCPNGLCESFYEVVQSQCNILEEYLLTVKQFSTAGSLTAMNAIQEKRLDAASCFNETEEDFWLKYKACWIAVNAKNIAYWKIYSDNWTSHYKLLFEFIDYFYDVDDYSDLTMQRELPTIRSYKSRFSMIKSKMSGYVTEYGSTKDYVGMVNDYLEKTELYMNACEALFMSTPYDANFEKLADKVDTCFDELIVACTVIEDYVNSFQVS